MRIGLVGGTGKEGRGLAMRWARAGHTVAVGSRDAARGEASAAELSELCGATIRGGDNAAAVADAEVVVLCVPYGGHAAAVTELADAIRNKVVIDITVPLKPPKVARVQLPAGQSAALEAQSILGEGARVVGALHHVSSTHLADLDHAIDCDVLVCADDKDTRELAMKLIGELGVRALSAGVLANSIALESLTPVLIHMNKRYKSASGTGIKITGIE